jgi:hypothetical protein
MPDARDLLPAFDFVSIDDDIVKTAMNDPDRMLRSLDAIHLATARVLEPDLTGRPRTTTGSPLRAGTPALRSSACAADGIRPGSANIEPFRVTAVDVR